MTRRMLLLVALSAGFLSLGGFGPNVCEAQTKAGWYYKIKYMNWSKTAWETHTRGPHSSKFEAESALQRALQVHYQYYPSVVKTPYWVASPSQFIVKLRELQKKESRKSEWVTVGTLGPYSSEAHATAERLGWERSGKNRRGFVEEIP